MGEGDIRKVDPRTGLLSCTQCVNHPVGQPNKIDVTATKETPMRALAHDGGDGKVVRHCFSCGSGGVVGRSDGTVECTICETVFTVQVQPRNTMAPQTVNGQPVHIPGMPEESTVTPSTEPPAPAAAPTPPPAEKPEKEKPEGEEDKPEFLTASGKRVSAEHYAQYLALGVTPDRERTLAMVRSANLKR